MRRITSVEILDQGLASRQEVESNLSDLWRINRYFGGVASSRRLLARFFERTAKRHLRVLEVGAGDGRLAARLRDDLSRQGITAEFVVLDRQLTHLLAGRPAAEGVHPVVADAIELPFAAGSFDLATCNLLFHHFSGEQALAVLRNLAAVARHGVLINDVERSWLAYLFVRFVPWFWRARISRLDGMASIRQAYTATELEGIAQAAGFKNFEVYRIALCRLGLVLWKSSADGFRHGRDQIEVQTQEESYEYAP
jgi:ubiquinone/menaquinone biosynthesis C-methylase UbiE